jgi:hypothetical protein
LGSGFPDSGPPPPEIQLDDSLSSSAIDLLQVVSQPPHRLGVALGSVNVIEHTYQEQKYMCVNCLFCKIGDNVWGSRAWDAAASSSIVESGLLQII